MQLSTMRASEGLRQGLRSTQVTYAKLAGVASYLPPDERTSEDVEARIRAASPGLMVPTGIIERTTGIRTRRFVADGVYSSDLASAAARRVLAQTQTDPEDVDLLIFASTSQDLTEPATANIVQSNIGTQGTVFDLKNACNSFLNALQVADSLICSGAYKTILITVGETGSRAVNWAMGGRSSFKRNFIGYTVGDAGAAAVLTASTEAPSILHQAFLTKSNHWNLSTIPGGGSRHPRGDEYSYFDSDGAGLRDAFLDIGPSIVRDALEATGTTFDDFSRVLFHQVSVPALDDFVRVTGIPREKVVLTVPEHGNVAAASMPLAFDLAFQRGDLVAGDLVLWVGLAAGVSAGVAITRV